METIIIKANKKQSKIVKAFLETQDVKFDISTTKKKDKESESPYDPAFVESIFATPVKCVLATTVKCVFSALSQHP